MSIGDNEHEGYGHNDANFHVNVIPNMKCPACGETASDEYVPHGTKYHRDDIV